MRRVVISEWDKERAARMLLNGEASRLEVRELGLGVATHSFDPPQDVPFELMYSAIVAFFVAIGNKIGSVYLFVGK